jgi:hypothetical protein
MHRIVGYGSNKKIINLMTHNKSREYLALQILDFIHDGATGIPIDELIDLTATWLYYNNNSLRSHITCKSFITYLTNEIWTYFNEQGIDPTMPVKYSLNTNTFNVDSIIIDDPPNIQVVIDQCDADKTKIFCRNKMRYVEITQSTMYDSGAFQNVCGDRAVALNGPSLVTGSRIDSRYYADGTLRVPNFSQQYFGYCNKHAVINMFSTATTSVCNGIRHKVTLGKQSINEPLIVHNFNQDYAIKGVLEMHIQDQSYRFNVVLAYRGYISSPLKNNTYLCFTHRIRDNEHLTRGYSPSNAMLNVLRPNIRHIIREGGLSDVLYAYTELVAKHWGDLGLILDVIGTNLYIVTNDNIVKILTATWGGNIIIGDIMCTSRGVDDIAVTYENNTGSLF